MGTVLLHIYENVLSPNILIQCVSVMELRSRGTV